MVVPEKPSLDGLEEKWSAAWERDATFRFDRSKPREQVYSIDTPPPTVSGSLHVGHVFSFTHTDTVARFQRMRGKAVFYPMGWDDNGLPTERRVQNYFGVRCDPSLPHDPSFEAPDTPPDPPVAVSRRNFVELCLRLTAEDEQAFEAVFRWLGLSVDWALTYTTIGEAAQRVSQRAFLRMLARGEAYQSEAPTLWDVDFRTAVAQAELEDRELPGAYHAIRFRRADGEGDVVIETTRPELIPACVALVAHPDDERYQALFDSEVLTPLFGVKVPVLADRLADPEKGSGIAMICTFGDTTDVTWWRELRLPARPVVGWDGRITGAPPISFDGNRAYEHWEELAGKTVKQAQKRIVELLRESGDLLAEPKPIVHAVKFYERGDRPLEIVTTRQWYFRNGGRDDGLRNRLLDRGRELRWHPPHMRSRYESWVEGLNGDWLISRQRFFGVPFPVWYRVLDDESVDWEHPIVPDEAQLPVDPSIDAPDRFSEGQRGKPGGFVGDPDVMDTWATSSLTPQIATGWIEDPDLFSRTFPMDLRPQAHEIIRTWLFSTVVRADLEHGALPWRHATISGWVLDPDRKKMSKSKGNVVTPMGLLEQYGSDAVRYWAASAWPGTDTAFDEGQMKVGRRLAIKLLNASKFALGVMGDEPPTVADVSAPIDRSMLQQLRTLVASATNAFEGYDYARSLEVSERFLWTFCDDYLELVKQRAYGGAGEDAARSARVAFAQALSTLLRLFAPHLPFVTEEVWSWWQEGSVHRAPWPSVEELLRTGEADDETDAPVLEIAATVLAAIRKAKSVAQRSMKSEVSQLVVRDSSPRLDALRRALDDLREAGRIVGEIVLEESAEAAIEIELVEPDAA